MSALIAHMPPPTRGCITRSPRCTAHCVNHMLTEAAQFTLFLPLMMSMFENLLWEVAHHRHASVELFLPVRYHTHFQRHSVGTVQPQSYAAMGEHIMKLRLSFSSHLTFSKGPLSPHFLWFDIKHNVWRPLAIWNTINKADSVWHEKRGKKK